MATRRITTQIALDGEQEFKKQMSSVNSELKTLKSEMGYVDAQFKGQANSMEALTAKDKLLRQEIEQQEIKVKALEQALQDASEAYGEVDKRTDSYKQQLNKAKTALVNMNRELEDTDKYLDEAKKSSDGCAKSIDEFGKSTKEGGGLLAKFTGVLDELGVPGGAAVETLGSMKSGLTALGVAGVAGAAVAGLKAVTEAAFELVDATEEYRKIMGTLEVSSQAAGYSAEETAETYNRLYGVLGDSQTAATTVANLQAIGLEQEHVRQLTDAAIGAWAKYGDSIPIDGLSEAINETIQVGKVTGTFADVLNWAGQSEDEFNEKLEFCANASERANLVLRTMAQQGLPEVGQAWRETNADIVANNEATAKMEAAQARLAEKLVPLTAGLKTLGAEALMSVLDAGEEVYEFFTDDIPEMLDATEAWFEALPEHLADMVAEFGQIGKNVVDGFIGGIKAKWNSAVSAVTGFVDNVKGVFTGASGFDTHSPSKWSEAMFGNVIEGMIVGNDRNAARAIAAAQETADGMLEALTIPDGKALSAQLSLSGTVGGGSASRSAGAAGTVGAKAEDFVINLTAMLDGVVVARNQYKYNKREGELRGGSLVEVTG